MKTIGTCENCEFWERDKIPTQGNCNNPKNDDVQAIPDSCNPRDAECFAACIRPGPQFGCVHWQDKRPSSRNQEPEITLAFLLFSCAQRVSNRIDERNGRQKFQLTPFDGWERMTNQQKTEWAEESEALASEILECLKFQCKQDLPNYQTTTAEERMIEDLRRENNAAFRRIQQLSEAIVTLGYDPTQLP